MKEENYYDKINGFWNLQIREAFLKKQTTTNQTINQTPTLTPRSESFGHRKMHSGIFERM